MARSAKMKDCFLLFGAFCNGNMGDVVQPISMEHLLASVTPMEQQCFYYAHPPTETPSKGFSVGKFFGGDESKLMYISRDTAWKVNRFKALIIGGGGIFSAMHVPLFVDMFAEAVTVPIVIMGVGANQRAKEFSTLLRKATFVSGRDLASVERMASVLRTAATPVVRPDDVWLVRDPVLSDKALTDTTGACWSQSQGDSQPLCFVLPAANTVGTLAMHQQLRARVVRRGDRFINVFPKHQEELAQFEYPGIVEEILDPMQFVKQLCSCKAIISTRFHGAILGLHMGVPTFGAFHVASENKVPDLMIDTMSLPDQFFLVDETLTREVVDQQVTAVRRSYEDKGRRGAIHDRLSMYHEEFKAQAHHVVFDVIGVARQQPGQQNAEFTQPTLSIEGGKWQPAKEMEEGLSTGNTAVIGSDFLFAICLLFVLAALAFMPSATGVAGRGTGQRLSETVATDGDHLSPSHKSQGEKDYQSWVQKEVDAGNGMDNEHGILLGGATGTTLVTSPSRSPPGGKGAPSTPKPSTALFVLNFFLWIALAVKFSTYSKSYLRDTHDPVGLLVLQGVSGSVVLFFFRLLGLGASDTSNASDDSHKCHDLRGLQMPLVVTSRREMLVAVLHSGQAFLTNVSLFVSGVAVTNALKAMEPVVAALFSYVLLGKKTTSGGLAAFAIIVAGILLLTFEGFGGNGRTDAGEATGTRGGGRLMSSRILVSAAFTMAAVSSNALRNVVIKKGDPIPAHHTLFMCSVTAGAIGVVLMLLRGMVRSMDELLLGGEESMSRLADGTSQYGSWLCMDGVNAALCFVGYNLASFNLLARLSPVGHAVGNSVKRIVMFGSGIVLMGEVMTARQLTGATVALVGVGVYNVASKRR